MTQASTNPASPSGPVSAFWRGFRVLLAVLGGCLAPCVLIGAAAVMLFLPTQGAELGRALSEPGALKQLGALVFASLLWGLMSWYWARRLLDFRFEERASWPHVTLSSGKVERLPPLPEALSAIGRSGRGRADAATRCWMRRLLAHAIDWAPRICAAAPFVLAFLLLAVRDGPVVARVVLSTVALLLVLILWFRRHILPDGVIEPHRRWVIPAAWAFTVVCVAIFLADPVTLGQAFGPVGSVFLFFAALLPLLGFASAWALRWRIPLVLVMVTGLVALPLVERRPGNERHLVRATAGEAPGARIELGDALAAWHEAQREPSSRAVPLVVVTAAGGGISAAVWTGLLLAAIQDRNPDFAERIFGISAVSGGALGAAVFAAAVLDGSEPSPAARGVCSRSAGLRSETCNRFGVVQAALTPDFLGPVFAGYVFSDTFGPLVNAAWPGLVPDDRAAVLERAWERACMAAGCAALGRSFFGMRPSAPDGTAPLWRPLLLLNGTHVETGKRIVTSQLLVTRRYFDDAFDFFDLHRRDILLSTAVMNAARFPYVTPAGLMRRSSAERTGHVVDGGYFENYGAETGWEVLRGAAALRERDGHAFYPVLIEISSDPQLTDRDIFRQGLLQAAPGSLAPEDQPVPLDPREAPPGWFEQMSGPINALTGTRSARGVQAAQRVWREAKRYGARPMRFTLCRQDPEGQRPPLGWSLSEATRDGIARDVVALFDATAPSGLVAECRARNRQAMQELLDALAGKGR